MIPKGGAWQELRQRCLSAIPEGVAASALRPLTLLDWHARGYYTVSATSSGGFDLVVPSADLGGALLADAEHLLDHAAEHQVTLWHHINTDTWLSPAWLAVTFYYWSFYLVLALTRLLGRTAWYLNKDAARALRTLAGVGTKAPGAGCFRMELAAPVSVTDRPVRLAKTDGRVHDEVWRIWDNLCRLHLAPLSQGTANSYEDRLYAAMIRAANVLGAEWPSSFRNLVNYRPGFAYTSVRRVKIIDAFSYLRSPSTYDMESLIARFESRVVGLQERRALETRTRDVTFALVDLTFLLHAIATELHAELLDRHSLDVRWRNWRTEFCRNNGVSSADGTWPS